MKFIGLIGWIVVCFTAAAAGAQFMPDEWYEALHRPSWTPPNSIFGPVWTALYLAMAFAAWLIWCSHDSKLGRVALFVFVLQLFVNAAWSWLFFGLHRIDLALADIALLLMLILVTMVLFFRQDRFAGSLMVPYFCWVLFAATLNLEFWRLN